MDVLNFSSSYLQYKSKQAKFTTWLKQTADSFRPADSWLSWMDDDAVSSGYILRLNDLQDLAQIIVTHLPRENIPLYVVEDLRDVVDARREFFRYHTQQTQRGKADKATLASNEAHLHIIRILESVLALFDRKVKREKRQPQACTGVPEENLSPVNIFEKLDVEYVDGAEVDAKEDGVQGLNPGRKSRRPKMKGRKSKSRRGNRKKTSGTDVPTVEEEYDLEMTDSEIDWMIYCFFKDFTAIRHFLQEKWCDYADGLLSLSAISVVTDTAMNIFLRAQQQLLSNFPADSPLADFDELVSRQLNQLNINYGTTAKEVEAHAEIYDECCGFTYSEMAEFLSETPPEELRDPVVAAIFQNSYSNPTAKFDSTFLDTLESDHPREQIVEETVEDNGSHAAKSCHQGIDHKSGWSRLSGYGSIWYHKVARNSYLMKELMSEMIFQNYCESNIGEGSSPIQDSLRRGLIQMIRTSKIPIWLVFACQVYLDIRYILDGDSDRPLHEMLRTADRVRTTLRGFLDADPWRPAGMKVHIMDFHLVNLETWVFNDVDFETRKYWYDAVKPLIIPRMAATYSFIDAEPFYIHRRYPVISGLLRFQSELSLQSASLDIINRSVPIYAAVNLYNMIRCMLPDSKAWIDMDALTAMHGDTTDMVDSAEPSNIRSFFESYVADDPDLTPFEKVERRVARRRIRKDEIHFTTPSTISEIFSKRYLPDSPATDPVLTLKNVETILKSLPIKVARGPDPTSLPGEYEHQVTEPDNIELRSIYNRSSTAITNESLFISPNKDFATTHTLDPIAFLSTLTSRLASESVLLNFNYISLHLRCTRIMCDIISEFALEMSEYNPWGKQQPINYHGLDPSGYEMWKVCNMLMCDGGAQIKTGKAEGKILRLQKIMEPYIAAEGAVEIETVRNVVREVGKGPGPDPKPCERVGESFGPLWDELARLKSRGFGSKKKSKYQRRVKVV